MASTVWAPCACGAVVADASAHAVWHARLALAAPGLALEVTTSEPDGDPVPVVVLPGVDAVGSLRERASAAVDSITDDALPALDAFLDASPPRLPTVKEYRMLVLIVRGLAVAVRALLRLAAHRLEVVE